MLLAMALIGVPSSICWLSLAGPPVSTTREMLPPRVVISAREASVRSVPCSMVTPPDSTVGVLSSRLPCCLPASMSIGWLRSDLRASAAGLVAIAIATTSHARACLGASGNIAGVDLGLERVLLAGLVHFKAIAAKYRTGPINGDPLRGRDPVGFREHVQRFGGDLHRGSCIAVAGGFHRATQAQLVALGTDPAGVGPHFPRIAFAGLATGRNQEQRGGDVHGAGAGVALQPRGAQGEGFASIRAQCDKLEIVQYVIGATTGRFQLLRQCPPV